MARPQSELQAIFVGMAGVQAAYFQPDQNTKVVDPAVIYERDDSWHARSDNILWLFKKRYTVTVIDREPDSLIPDQVEALPHSTFNRFFRRNGLNHFVFQLYF